MERGPTLRLSPGPGAHRFKQLGVCLVLTLIMAGCGGNNASPTPGPTATTEQTTASTATAAPTTAALATPTTAASENTPTEQAAATAQGSPVAAGGTFQNPVLENDFADPDVIAADGAYYAYATNASGRNIEAAKSTDLVTWELLTDAMPALPSWAQLGGSLVWAPAVAQIGQKYVMYYTARDTASDKQCIGVATADKPDGKFLDKNDHAFVCMPAEGGDIDASPFSDGGKYYLYWKNDGNCCGITTYIYGQELSADGLTLVGEPKRLIQNDQNWEGRVIEGPEMWKHDTGYYLFFSAGNYADATYGVGYATCDGPLGPCKQADENPILHSKVESEPLVIGPGGESLIQVGDQTWMLYHVWDEVSGSRGDARYMWLDRVDWQSGKPVVKGPTTGPQPKPKP
jgi:beta-xylosidase